jgi:adenylylsulfate kinase
MIILMAGLPGTGKSTLARELARLTQGCVLGKDEIRGALFPPEAIEYSTRQDDFIMEIMLQTASYLLQRNPERKIFLDGRPFSRRYQIDRVQQFASELHQPCQILECVCKEDTARTRLQSPDPAHPAGNRTFDLYLEVKSRLEPITQPKTVISTDQPLEQCVQQALPAVKRPSN